MTPPNLPRPSFAGVLGGVLFAAGALGPSLLPRPALIAGLLAGVTAAIGYAVGAGVGFGVRASRGRLHWRSTPHQRSAAAIASAAVLGVAGIWAWLAQEQLSSLMAVPAPGVWWAPTALLVGAAIAALLVLAGRGLRRLTRWLQEHMARVAPRPVATASAVSVVAVAGLLAVGRLPVAMTTVLNPLFASMNASTTAGLAQPTSAVVSGAPGSAVSWASLGHDGRDFVGGVTPTDEIAAFSGQRAQAPIRVYVGVDSSPSDGQRAQLALQDLDRFGAWDRAVLAVGTSTGTGTVDQGEVTPLEYMYAGDVATVSTQYSVLPSFLSFLVDGQNAQDAARTLFDAVYARWQELPADRRPRLVVFGESLGAFGGDAAFPNLADLAARTSGSLFVGPPNGTALWQQLTDDRQPGTPQWLPQYGDGQVVRWADLPSDLDQPDAPWGRSRAAYLQNASDPVVWWSPRVLWSRPDWYVEPKGPDVLPDLTWLPLFSFVGLTGDMINSQGVPVGHGHVYGDHQAAAWARIVPPPGWTQRDTEHLLAVTATG